MGTRFSKVDIPEIRKPNRRIGQVYLHCSASDHAHHDNPQTIHAWHVERGFNEIGYHFFINKKGEIFYGRDIEKVPAAQKGHNTGSIAICLHGLKKENFTDDQKFSLKALCYHLESLYYGGLTFHGHCEVEPLKSCPVFPYKVWLRLDENGRLNQG